MSKIMYEGISYANAGVSSDATSIPTADMTAAFDNTAHMNSTDMTSQEVEDFVDGLDGQGANLTDYVVEQGTSDIWTYRKWNSGIAECWGRYTVNLSHYAGPYGTDFYGYHTSISFPSGLFIETPTHTYTSSIASTFAITASGIGTTNTSMGLYAIATISGTQSCTFDMMAIGKWK